MTPYCFESTKEALVCISNVALLFVDISNFCTMLVFAIAANLTGSTACAADDNRPMNFASSYRYLVHFPA